MGTMSGATQGQLIAALRFLDLVTDNGTPTNRLRKLVENEGEERKELLRDMVSDAYVDVFRADSEFLDTGTYRQLSEAFAATGAQGETLRKCVAFYLLASRDAELVLSPHFNVRGSRSAGSPRRRKTQQTPKREQERPMREGTRNLPDHDGGPLTGRPLLLAVMRQLPKENTWDQRARDAWLDLFTKALDWDVKVSSKVK